MDIFQDTLRASPLIILVTSLLIFIVTGNMLLVRFFFYYIIADLLAHGLKFLFSKTMPNSEFIYRPVGAGKGKGCGLFLKGTEGDINRNIGFPSGHSLGVSMACTFWCLYILKETDRPQSLKILSVITLCLITLAVLLSRTSLVENCHTPLQVVTGSLLGIGLGIGFYQLEAKKYLFK